MSRDEMYVGLSERYGWTPQQIADMTPAQQIMYLEHDPRPGATPAGMTPAEARAELRRKQGKAP